LRTDGLPSRWGSTSPCLQNGSLRKPPALQAMHGVTRYGKLVMLIATSKRLQVLLDEAELREIQRAARAQNITVAAWVRQALRAARIQAAHGRCQEEARSCKGSSQAFVHKRGHRADDCRD
jgi:post-segregation antitoxin (ccd killing protein)